MTRLLAGGVGFDVDAVAFDKDGTLIDLNAYWLEPARAWVMEGADGDPILADLLSKELGLAHDRLHPGGPFAMGTVEELRVLTAETLRGWGLTPGDAARRTEAARARAMDVASSIPLRPLGDVPGALRRLVDAGLGLAVITSDDLTPTLRALGELELAELMGLVLVADGNVPPKPDPAVVATVADHFDTCPGRVLVVGDSPVDAEAARAGGAAGFVLMDSHGDLQRHVPHDAAVGSIEELATEHVP